MNVKTRVAYAQSLNRVQRGEALLNKLTSNGSVTPSGRDFLIAALDPMHDTQLKELAGWPDVETASSVVRCVKQTVTVSTPFTTTTPNWDCHVVTWPMFGDYPTSFVSQGNAYSNNALYYGNSATASVGGIRIYGMAQGNALNVSSPAAFLDAITLAPQYENGASRLVGCGIEVVNTTSDLLKQGQVTVYRQSQSHIGQDTYLLGGLGLDTLIGSRLPFSGHFIRSPPLTQADAMLIPGTRQWKAADGCYLVTPFVGQDNPPQLVGYTQPLVTLQDQQEVQIHIGGTGTSNIDDYIMPQIQPDDAAVSQPCLYATKIYPVHMPGAIFSGLSGSSTLSITVNMYIETFPTPAQNDILVLATPSASYDPVALELFSRALTELPVGVPAGMNGLGEWFAGVIKSITSFTTPMLAAMGQPGLALASGGANAAARSYLASQSPQTKLQLTPAQRQKKKANKEQRKKLMQEQVTTMVNQRQQKRLTKRK
jgi:hypothetical protein